MKAKTFCSLALTALTALLGGCSSTFTNYTGERVPQNPSGIYTISFEADIPAGNVVSGTERAKLIINGESYEMQKTSEDPLIFSYDYPLPAGVTEFRYYFELSYDYVNSSVRNSAVRYSTEDTGKIYTSRLINRYPIQLISDRGPVGSKIALSGSGFTGSDVVSVGGVDATTEVISSNSIEFIVPALPAGRSYPVVVRTGTGEIPFGMFRVDEAKIRVQPARLALATGEAELMIFEIDNVAPAGGVYVNVTTSIPDSIIMPEVVIPAGARSVNVAIEGGQPGSGNLYVEADGFKPVTIPVTVQ